MWCELLLVESLNPTLPYRKLFIAPVFIQQIVFVRIHIQYITALCCFLILSILIHQLNYFLL